MAQVNLSASVDKKVKQAVEHLAKPENDGRSFSNMVEKLLREALKIRKFDFKMLEKNGK